jgi:hypothetical protein
MTDKAVGYGNCRFDPGNGAPMVHIWRSTLRIFHRGWQVSDGSVYTAEGNNFSLSQLFGDCPLAAAHHSCQGC